MLEQRVTLGATDVVGDVPLTGLVRVHAEVLSPGVAVERVVGQPLLTVLVCVGVAAAVDAEEVVVALSTLHQVTVSVGSSPVCRYVMATS